MSKICILYIGIPSTLDGKRSEIPYLCTVLIGEEDSHLITISAIRLATLYYLLGQYYLIQEAKPCWLPEAMSPIEFPRLCGDIFILSIFESILTVKIRCWTMVLGRGVALNLSRRTGKGA